MDSARTRDELERQITPYRDLLLATPCRRLLLDEYGLAGRLPHVHLADGLPTPITALGSEDGPVLVKRDDLTSSLYGGNKVRKLEFVLAEVERRRCVPVIVGTTRSTHPPRSSTNRYKGETWFS